MWDVGQHVMYHDAFVKQTRNVHEYMGDYMSERPLYETSQELIRVLHSELSHVSSVPEAIESAYIVLYEFGFIQDTDVRSMQLWIQDLNGVGYDWPAIQAPHLGSGSTGTNATASTGSSSGSGTGTGLSHTHTLNRVLLLGQFNYPTKQVLLKTWRARWATVFPIDNIWTAYPSSDNDTTLDAHVLRHKSDRGFYSPYLNLARMIIEAESLGMRGVLYAHDDKILTKTFLQHVASGDEKCPLMGTFQIPKNSTHRIIQWRRDRQLPENYPRKWTHWKNCRKAFVKMTWDKRLTPFFDAAGGVLPIAQGASDMAYVDTRNSSRNAAMRRLLEIFGDYQLFLECALPSALSIVSRLYEVGYHQVSLCTNWEPDKRPHPERWACMNDTTRTFEAYHPLKLSRGHWTMFFDREMGLV